MCYEQISKLCFLLQIWGPYTCVCCDSSRWLFQNHSTLAGTIHHGLLRSPHVFAWDMWVISVLYHRSCSFGLVQGMFYRPSLPLENHGVSEVSFRTFSVVICPFTIIYPYVSRPLYGSRFEGERLDVPNLFGRRRSRGLRLTPLPLGRRVCFLVVELQFLKGRVYIYIYIFIYV